MPEQKQEFFFTVSKPHEWSSGPRTFTRDPETNLPIASLKRAEELAKAAFNVGTHQGDKERTVTTWGSRVYYRQSVDVFGRPKVQSRQQKQRYIPVGGSIPPKPRIFRDKKNKNLWRMEAGPHRATSGSFEGIMHYARFAIAARREFFERMQQSGKSFVGPLQKK